MQRSSLGSPPTRKLRAAYVSQPGTTGKLLSAGLASGGISRGDGSASPELVRPKGLVFFLSASSTQAANVLLQVGTPVGAGQITRTFTLTNSGVWITAASWNTVNAEIISVGADDVRVGYSWTVLEPPTDDAGRMFLVQAITAGGPSKVPEGAFSIVAATTDAAWSWTSNATGVALSLTTGVSSGVKSDVLGDLFTAGVNNVVVWELWSP